MDCSAASAVVTAGLAYVNTNIYPDLTWGTDKDLDGSMVLCTLPFRPHIYSFGALPRYGKGRLGNRWMCIDVRRCVLPSALARCTFQARRLEVKV